MRKLILKIALFTGICLTISPGFSFGQSNSNSFMANQSSAKQSPKPLKKEITKHDSGVKHKYLIPGSEKVQSNNSQFNKEMWKVARDAQQEYHGNLTQSIGITIAIVGLVNAMILLAIGYYIIKRNKQYTHIIRDARDTHAQTKDQLDALMQMRDHALKVHDQLQQSFSQVRNWESKTRDKLRTMYAMHTQLTKDVMEKIKSFEMNNAAVTSDTKSLIAQLAQVSESQREAIDQTIETAISKLKSQSNETVRSFTENTQQHLEVLNSEIQSKTDESAKQFNTWVNALQYQSKINKQQTVTNDQTSSESPTSTLDTTAPNINNVKAKVIKKTSSNSNRSSKDTNIGQNILKAFIDETENSRNDLEKERSIQASIQKISNLRKKAKQEESNKNYINAANYYEEITSLAPKDHEAFYCWGNVLAKGAIGKEPRNVLTSLLKACDKYHRSIMVNPDYYEALNNWGIVLKNRARLAKEPEADGLYGQAYEKFTKSITLNPQNHEAWSNWGNTLLAQSAHKSQLEMKTLLGKACKKFEKALSIKPNKAIASHQWGIALFRLANNNTGNKRLELLKQAEEKWLAAEATCKGISATYLAGLNASQGVERECRKWLEISEQAGTLESRRYAMNTNEFETVREKQWFQEMKWK